MKRPILRATVFSALCLLGTLSPACAAEEENAGKVAFNNACRTCHSMKEGDNRLGPTLHGVVGRKAGSVAGYKFSSAMQGAGITWDDATLDKFITNPETVVHGNNMKPFGGVADAAERSKIITYLKTLTD
jgi:cytochrome c